ncbi:MAG: sigma-70 family RNA polymerase sigma factor [Clostridia bacterium]|nr:sigma-70 family RNA polymerase sigma factor [Clostridia bacterium]
MENSSSLLGIFLRKDFSRLYETCLDDILAAKAGDKEVLNEIIENNSKLVWSVVRRFNGRGYELEDLFQIGAMGFIKAIQRFDESYEVKLSTFAVPYILGEIKRFIRDDGAVKVSRSLKELLSKINLLNKEYEKRGKKLEISDIERELKESREDIILALETQNPIESIQSEIFEDGGMEKQEVLVLDKDEEEDTVNKILIKEELKRLDERDRNIIILRYFKEKTQVEVAEIYGISQVQVSRLEKRILEQMRKRIG